MQPALELRLNLIKVYLQNRHKHSLLVRFHSLQFLSLPSEHHASLVINLRDVYQQECLPDLSQFLGGQAAAFPVATEIQSTVDDMPAPAAQAACRAATTTAVLATHDTTCRAYNTIYVSTR